MSVEYKIHIDEAVSHSLRKQAEELGITINTLMRKILEDTAPPTLETAATTFLAQLPEDHRNLILSLSNDTKRPPASYILRAHEQGATASLFPESMLETVVTPLPVGNKTKTCEWCKKDFTTSRDDQRYCPDPLEGESCGRQAGLADVRARRRAHKTLDPTMPIPHTYDRVLHTS